MRQVMTVGGTKGPGRAEVFLRRPTACSGDCGSCGGCGAASETVCAEAENLIGAAPGDRVVVETETRHVLLSAFFVYLLPVILFFAGYFFGSAEGWKPGLSGGLGFLLGFPPMLLWNRRMEKKKLRIVGFARE